MKWVLFVCLSIALVEGRTKVDPLEEEYKGLKPKATFYDEENFNGSSTSVQLADGSVCKNLPRRWRGSPLSVDTSGTCISVCDEPECSGQCVRIYPNTGDLKLATVGMDKKITSVKGCF